MKKLLFAPAHPSALNRTFHQAACSHRSGPSAYPKGYAEGPEPAEALLDSHFEHPARVFCFVPNVQIIEVQLY